CRERAWRASAERAFRPVYRTDRRPSRWRGRFTPPRNGPAAEKGRRRGAPVALHRTSRTPWRTPMGRVTGLVRCVNETRIGRPAPRRRVATDGQALAAKRRLKHHYGICEQQLLRYVELARGRPGGAGE